MTPFHGRGSTASTLVPPRGCSLLFTTKPPEIPGTHFINLRRMKDCIDFGSSDKLGHLAHFYTILSQTPTFIPVILFFNNLF